MHNLDTTYNIKLLVVGEESVGKTTLILRFMRGKFIVNIDYNLKGVNWFRKKVIVKGNKEVMLDIWDIAGKARFKEYLPYLTTLVNGIMITFDTTSLDSLENLSDWIHLLNTYLPESVPRILVGLKHEEDRKNKISRVKIYHFVRKHNIKDYYQVSSRIGKNIHSLFKEFLERTIDAASALKEDNIFNIA
ncbi:MAG: Rab family GTPase [Candidatus Hodarchaeales archaeon]|jgi:small GTP-binding protein